MFISVYASGTNVQRLAKCSKNIDGVVYTAYSELEKSEPGIVKRKFFCTEVGTLKSEVEKLDVEVMPSWTKIWGKPHSNSAFIGGLLTSLTGGDTLRRELNLSSMTDTTIDCFMLLVSANKREMGQIADIASRVIPDWHIKVLNGDFTSNKKAEYETTRELNEAKLAGKRGVIIIANQMGSRSYSIPAIQATVIAYDRGSVDATSQKVSRCLTPPSKEKLMYDGSDKKTHGYIVDLSFDPNRSENIEKLIIDESVQVQRALDIDFSSGVKYVLSSIDMFKMNRYGIPVEVSETELFKTFSDNDTMLRVADISVDITTALQTGIFDIFASVTAGSKSNTDKKDIVGEGVKNSVTEGGDERDKEPTDAEKKHMEDVINNAIRALNMSATSVYFLADGGGESYRDCLNNIVDPSDLLEFVEFYGVTPSDVITLLDNRALNEPILDVIVQNSKPQVKDDLFA